VALFHSRPDATIRSVAKDWVNPETLRDWIRLADP
jgi:transposase-like protein